MRCAQPGSGGCWGSWGCDTFPIASLVVREGGFKHTLGRGLYRLLIGEQDPKAALPSVKHGTELAAGYEQLPDFLLATFGKQQYLP
jgi:hypothetical protein